MLSETVCTLVPSTHQELSSSVESLFDFDAEHNGVQCIESLRPEHRGTKSQFWFTVAMLCTIFDVAERTLRDNVESLVDDGEVDCEISQSTVTIKDSMGRDHKTTIYNLEVLNKLGMCCFRGNKRAKEVRNKFNDIIVKAETGQILTVEDMIANPDTTIRLLTEIKTLRNQNRQLEVERDEAVRTKAMIGSRREATAMATASAKSRECKKLTAENEELTAENEELTAENEGLKDAIGRGTNWRTVSMMTSEWIRDFGHAPSYHKLKKFSLDLERDEMPVKDVEEKVILKNGSEKVNVVNRYHRKAWERYREYEETIRATAV